MYCKNCGNQLNENAAVCLQCGVLAGEGNRFCPNCGAQPDPLAVVCVKCGRELRKVNPTATTTSSSEYDGTFGGAIKHCFSNFVEFNGRATKSEFWYFQLFAFIVSIVTCGFGSLVTFLPNLAVCIRRLHDTNRSGAMYFVAFIPFVGWIFLLIWFCDKSHPGDNKYGSYPRQF